MMKDLFVYGPGESLSLAHNIDVAGAPLRKISSYRCSREELSRRAFN